LNARQQEPSARRTWDCVIVGGGPAGLVGATYLGRFRRSVLVIDAGESRMKRIPLSRNVPGFPDGIAGTELYARMRRQAEAYGASFEQARVDQMSAAGDHFTLIAEGETHCTRYVLLATGAQLDEPNIANLDDALHQGRIRYCPICDGFETRGLSVAVLGGRPSAFDEAKFLRTFAERVTYLWLAEAAPTEKDRAAAALYQIRIAEAPVLSVDVGERVEVRFADAESASFDVLYPCLGCDPRSHLAQSLGARVSEQGGVLTDAHQRTNVPGLYAAGDVLQGLDQIASACGQAATAATDIHNALRAAEEASLLARETLASADRARPRRDL